MQYSFSAVNMYLFCFCFYKSPYQPYSGISDGLAIALANLAHPLSGVGSVGVMPLQVLNNVVVFLALLGQSTGMNHVVC